MRDAEDLKDGALISPASNGAPDSVGILLLRKSAVTFQRLTLAYPISFNSEETRFSCRLERVCNHLSHIFHAHVMDSGHEEHLLFAVHPLRIA